MSQSTVTVETWVIVDEEGNYEVGTAAAEAAERYEETIGEMPASTRLVKVVLTVPLPQAITVTATVPELGTVKGVVS